MFRFDVLTFFMVIFQWTLTLRLGDVAAFENRQPVTPAKFITKCSLFILLLSVIHRLELKPISEQKVENLFVAPPYCQTDVSYRFYFNVVCFNLLSGVFI